MLQLHCRILPQIHIVIILASAFKNPILNSFIIHDIEVATRHSRAGVMLGSWSTKLG